MGGGGYHSTVYAGSGGGFFFVGCWLHRCGYTGAVTPAPIPKPEPPAIDQLLQRLVAETQARQPAPAAATGSAGLETLLINWLSGNLAPQYGNLDREPYDRIGMR